jgi:hypothetical protein
MAFAKQETFDLINVVFKHCCNAKALLLYICKRVLYVLMRYYLTTDVVKLKLEHKNTIFTFLPPAQQIA